MGFTNAKGRTILASRVPQQFYSSKVVHIFFFARFLSMIMGEYVILPRRNATW